MIAINFFLPLYRREAAFNDADTTVKFALSLQGLFRGWKEREEYKSLSLLLENHLFETGKKFIDDDRLGELKRSIFGHKEVYISNVGIVIKNIEATPNRLRYSQEAQRLCYKHNLSSLHVPRVQSYSHYLIEEKVQSLVPSIKYQMCLYRLFSSKFDLNIRDACHLFFNALNAERLVSNYYLPFTLAETHIFPSSELIRTARIDNVCFKNDFTLALVDLEWIHERKMFFEGFVKEQCKILILFFPFHFDMIVEIGQTYDKSFKTSELLSDRDDVIKRYLVVVDEHLKFVQTHGILSDFETKKHVIVESFLKTYLPELNEYTREYFYFNQDDPKTNRLKTFEKELLINTAPLVNAAKNLLLTFYEENLIEYYPEDSSVVARQLNERTAYFEKENADFKRFVETTALYFSHENQKIYLSCSYILLLQIYKEFSKNEMVCNAIKETRNLNGHLLRPIDYLIIFF